MLHDNIYIYNLVVDLCYIHRQYENVRLMIMYIMINEVYNGIRYIDMTIMNIWYYRFLRLRYVLNFKPFSINIST